MRLKKKTEIKFLLLVILCVILSSAFLNSNYSDKKKSAKIEENNISPLTSEEPFQLIQDFTASTYFISPESSLGEMDGVFFSFMANKDGNYTVQIENYPNFLTDTAASEAYTSFDNPTGTNLWYIGYAEMDILNLGQFNFKMLISEDYGKTWTNRLIKSVYANVSDQLDILTYIYGMAIAVHPKTGFMTMVTWLNRTQLIYFKSYDNGTTWSDPIPIFNTTFMGTKDIFGVKGDHPRIDVAILKNGTIIIVSEANDSKFTKLVYVESPDNGTTWYLPQNITCSKGSDAKIPKLQVDHVSGDYWLMWKNYGGSSANSTYRWAKFNSTQNLYNNTQYLNVTKYNCPGNFDFYYDHKNSKFRLITIEFSDSENVQIINWTCNSFQTNSWRKTLLGIFGLKEYISNSNEYLNYIFYLGSKIFFRQNYLGTYDIYQYNIYENYVYWKKSGDFNQNELKQIYWNGKKGNGSPIENSLVKVTFTENHTKEAGIKSLYIIIDNEYPSMKQFQQNRQYFNPKSTNITLAEIPWEILPSESCESYLKIFSQKISNSSWNQVTQNNWEDSNPKIFFSNKGILYVVYRSYEAGRKIIYLTKSYDMGVVWSNPVKIYEYYGSDISFTGAAWGDSAFIYVHEKIYNQYLYRSFDQGNNFQNPINIYDSSLFPMESEPVSSIVITNNGTMFMTYKNASTQFYIIKSNDLGLNWTILKIFPGNASYHSQFQPVLAYDSVNELIYFARIQDKTFEDYSKILEVSFSTFNISKNNWSTLQLMGIFDIGAWFSSQPIFYIARTNATATPKVHLIYLSNVELPELTLKYKEFVSKDLGLSWSGPTGVTLSYFEDVTSNLDELCFISIKSDGNDGELYFKRVGRLIRVSQITLFSSSENQIVFDGINDFGDYLEEGNYTYFINLRDNAGNLMQVEGWFYVDYYAPKIVDYSTNWAFTPIPRYNVEITVNITDSINFTAYLYYKKDNGSWQEIILNNKGSDYFTATIPSDTVSNEVQYYIKAVDLAGNEYILDNSGTNFNYDMPSFIWSSEGLFKETDSYSSSKTYDFEITITKDLEYVSKVIFRYSYDEGDSWDDLELEHSSPDFSGTLEEIPGDLRELYYKIILIDIFGNEYELTDTNKVEFYPEVPDIEFNTLSVLFMVIVSGVVGFMVAYGYIKLKHTSHDFISKQIFHKELKKKADKIKRTGAENLKNERGKNLEVEEDKIKEFEKMEKSNIAMPFTMVYIGILGGTVLMFSLGMFISYVEPAMGILILAGSLLLGVYGYMILMSRDITINIYLEKIFKRNLLLEGFQMGLMLINILMILFVGYSMDWFRYYLVESTFNLGTLSIPKLYLSVLAVFFTSLVLVIITTYVQLRKTVYNILKQRTQKASENLLFYLKDQNSSRMITHMGYKTIVFLVTVLLGVVTTTNLLTYDTGIALTIILVPFVIAGFTALIVTRIIEKKKKEKEKESIEMLFIDSKKICTKCGEPAYLSDKYCGSCGVQLIFSDMLGKYVSRCSKCNALVNEKAKFCPECGKEVQKNVIKKS